MTDIKNPYVGPRAFEPGETLHGRERELRQIESLLIAERLVLLHSPSGAGKTSLIQAGLVPSLKGQDFNVPPVIRVNLEPPAELLGLAGFNRYTFSAMASLEEGQPPEVRLPYAELAALGLEAYLERHFSAENDLALVFDQFEEILTTSPADRETKQAFFNDLGRALRKEERWALFSMREDYLGALAPYLRPIPGQFKNRYRLDLLGPESAKEAIQKPAQSSGVKFGDETAQKLLDDLRVIQVQQPDGSFERVPGQHIEPVQLQVVCYNLWQSGAADDERITIDDLQKVGSVDDALAAYYAESIQRASEKSSVDERAIRQWFSEQLITPDGIRSQALRGQDTTAGLSNRVLGQLENAHLIRGETRAGKTWYELAHDRLVEPVRKSNAAWFDENLSLLQKQAKLWGQKDRGEGLLLRGKEFRQAQKESRSMQLTPEEIAFLDACRKLAEHEQRERRRNVFMTFLAIGATIAMIVAGIFYLQAQSSAFDAQRAASVAQAASTEAVIQKDEAESQKATAQVAEQQSQVAEQQAQLSAQKAVDAKAETEATLKKTEIELREARNQQLSAQAQLVGSESPARALLLAMEAIRINQQDSAPVSPAAYQSLRDGLSNSFGIVLAGNTDTILALTFSPNGRWLASGGKDKIIRVWDLQAANSADKPALTLTGHKSEVKFLAIGNNGRLVSGDGENNIFVWDITNPEASPKTILEGKGQLQNLVISPDGRWLAFNREDSLVRVWDFNKPEAASQKAYEFVIGTENPGEGGLAFSADGKWLVAACGREIKAWKTLPGSLVEYKVNLPEIIPTAELQAFYDWISKEYKAGLPSTLMSNFYKISFSTDQNWLSSGGRAWRMDMFPNSMPQSKEWSRWRLECKKQIIIWVGQDESPCDGKGYFSNITYAVSPLGQWWAWSSSYFKYYQDFSVWVRNNQKEFRLEGHQGPVRQLVFTPDKRWLVSASGTVKDWQGDGTIRFWDLASPDPNTNPLIYYTGSENPLLSLSPDGKWLVVVSENQVIRLLDIQTMNFTQDPIRFKQISNLFLSPDNQWIFGTDGQGMQLLDLSAQNPTMATTSLGLYSSALFGKSGKWVILSNSQHDDSQIRSLSNQKNFDLPVSLYRFWFSNDDHWLVGSSSDLFYLYNISTLDTSPAEAFIASNSYSNDKQVTAFAWESIWHQAARVFFDSTNHWLITSVGKDTRLVNLFSTKQPYESFMLQNISALAISPNGKQLATLDFVTSQATILDLEKMEPMQLVFPKTTLQQVLFEGDRPVSAEFSPNGEWLFISTCESVLVSDDKTPRDSRQPGCVQAGKASIYLWNPILADPMKSAVHIPGIGSFTIEFSSNNRWLRAKDSTGKVTLLDLSKTQPGSIELTASSNLFDPASRWFASTGTSGGIILYDLTSPNMRVISVTTPGYQLASLAFSPDGAWLAAGTSTGKVLLWNMREDGPESVFYVLDGGSKTYNQLFFSKDGRWLLAGGPEEEFVSWHMETNTLLEMACTSAGRNLTRAEWTQYGFTENYRATCPQWPIEPEPTSTPTP